MKDIRSARRRQERTEGTNLDLTISHDRLERWTERLLLGLLPKGVGGVDEVEGFVGGCELLPRSRNEGWERGQPDALDATSRIEDSPDQYHAR